MDTEVADKNQRLDQKYKLILFSEKFFGRGYVSVALFLQILKIPRRFPLILCYRFYYSRCCHQYISRGRYCGSCWGKRNTFNSAEYVEERKVFVHECCSFSKGLLLLYTVLVRSTIFSSKGYFINRSIQQRENQHIQNHQKDLN